MNIIIKNSGEVPIYEQIVSQIKNQIICGALSEGEALPSMRMLAKELRISVITTKRAYEELEKEGFIVSVTGRGSFVSAKNTELFKEEHLKVCEEHLSKASDYAKLCGVSFDELCDILRMIYKGEEK